MDRDEEAVKGAAKSAGRKSRDVNAFLPRNEGQTADRSRRKYG